MEKKILLAILFLKGKGGIKRKDIARLLKIKPSKVIDLIDQLNRFLIEEDLPFLIKNFDDYFWMAITSEISLELSKNMRKHVPIKLSKSLVETLTIIAYNQPVSRTKIEKIRGVSADYALLKLLEYDLIYDLKETGKGNRRNFYTTPYFLKLFNLRTLEDLPKLEKDFEEKTEEVELFNYD